MSLRETQQIPIVDPWHELVQEMSEVPSQIPTSDWSQETLTPGALLNSGSDLAEAIASNLAGNVARTDPSFTEPSRFLQPTHCNNFRRIRFKRRHKFLLLIRRISPPWSHQKSSLRLKHQINHRNSRSHRCLHRTIPSTLAEGVTGCIAKFCFRSIAGAVPRTPSQIATSDPSQEF